MAQERFTPLSGPSNVTSIWGLDDNTLWAGSDHGIFKTVDGGASWNSESITAPIKKIWGNKDRIFATTDNAPYFTKNSEWSQSDPIISVNDNEIIADFDDIHGFETIVGVSGPDVVISKNNGISWIRILSSQYSYTKCFMINESNIWIAGRDGRVAHFDGRYWTESQINPNIDIAGIYAADHEWITFLANGKNGTPSNIYITKDKGNTFLATASDLQLEDSSGFATVYDSISGTGRYDIWAVGDASILHMDNTDLKWHECYNNSPDFDVSATVPAVFPYDINSFMGIRFLIPVAVQPQQVVVASNFKGAFSTRGHIFFAGDTIYHSGAMIINGIDPSIGSTAGGTNVEITGENFSTGIVVDINGTPAVIISFDRRKITITTPPGLAGFATATVTNKNRTSSLSGYTYFPQIPHSIKNAILYYLMAGKDKTIGNKEVSWISALTPDYQGKNSPKSVNAIKDIYVKDAFYGFPNLTAETKR